MKILKNQQGSLVIQALISVAIFGAVTASIVRLLQLQDGIAIKTTEQFEMVYFVDEVRNILSNPRACTATLKNKKSRQDRSINAINQFMKDNSQNGYTFPIFEKGETFKETEFFSLKLNEIYLQQHDNEVLVNGGTTGLHFVVEFRDKRSGRIKMIERSLKLFVTINNAEEIQDCYTLRGIGLNKEIVSKSTHWLRTSDNKGYYLNNKALSIATSTNTAPLNIGGALQLKGESGACNKIMLNSLRFNQKNKRFEFCSPGPFKWRDLEETPPLKLSGKSLRVKFPSTQAKTLKPYKYCQIVYKNFEEGQCNLTRLIDGRWQIDQHSEEQGHGSCEATCLN